MDTPFTLNDSDISITPKGTTGITVTKISTEQYVYCDTFPTKRENTYAAIAVLSSRLGVALIVPKE